MKKIFALVCALCMSASLFAGCGNKDDSSSSAETTSNAQTESTGTDNSEASEKYPASAEPIDIKNGATENMLKRSVLNEGDTSRLAEKLNNAIENPEQTTKICFLGDSITQGSAATSSKNQYHNQFKTWWEENVSYYVDVVNAGIGATDSYIGVHRAQRDVLDDQPDIIFIEFINDVDNEFYKACMDSLIRKCMSAENNPAVVLVEMTMEDGTCPQNIHSELGKEYNLPIISYHDAVLPEVQAGSLAWTAISPDNIHPNDDGHVLLGSLLTNFVSGIKDNLATLDKVSKPFDAESPTGDIYKNAYLGSRESDTITVKDEGTFTDTTSFQKFYDGWGTTTGGSITFEIEAQNIGMIYYKTTDGKSGKATINIDGDDVSTLDGDFTGGWGNYAKADQIYTSDKTAKHTITVTVEDGDAKNFQILNWLIS